MKWKKKHITCTFTFLFCKYEEKKHHNREQKGHLLISTFLPATVKNPIPTDQLLITDDHQIKFPIFLPQLRISRKW